MADDDQVAAIEASIVEQVGNHWNESHTALLLTTLGSNLKQFHPDYRDVIGRGLEAFLRERNIVQLIAHPDIKQKIGLAPLGVQISSDLRLLFAPRKRVSSGIMFRPEFWNAFHLPLEGRRRFVIITAQGFEINELDNAPSDQEFYEIRPEDIVVGDGAPIPELVSRKWTLITRWLGRHKLTAEKFTATPDRQHSIRETQHIGTLGLFKNLEQQDQARILIPLDIVLKLLK